MGHWKRREVPSKSRRMRSLRKDRIGSNSAKTDTVDHSENSTYSFLNTNQLQPIDDLHFDTMIILLLSLERAYGYACTMVL